MRRGLLLGGVALLSVAFAVWGFAGSSFSTGAAVAGALGAALLGLAVFFRVRRGATGWGVTAVVGTQFLYLALWIAGGLLWAGPPRELPRFASPVQPRLGELQGQWTHEGGESYVLRGSRLCPERTSGKGGELRRIGSPEFPPDPCLTLVQEPDGRLTIYADDMGFDLVAYRSFGREVLTTEWFDHLTFSRPIPPD